MPNYPFGALPEQHIRNIVSKADLVSLLRFRQGCHWLNEEIQWRKYTAKGSIPIHGIIIIQKGSVLVRTKYKEEEDFRDSAAICGVHFNELVISSIDPWVNNPLKWASSNGSIFQQLGERAKEKFFSIINSISCDYLVIEELPFFDDIQLISSICRRYYELKINNSTQFPLDFRTFSQQPFTNLSSLSLSTSAGIFEPGPLFEAVKMLEFIFLDFTFQKEHSLINFLATIPHFIWNIHMAYLSGDLVAIKTFSMFYESPVEDIHEWKSYRELPKLLGLKPIWNGKKHISLDEDDLGADSIMIYSREVHFTIIIKMTALSTGNANNFHIGMNLRVISSGLDNFVEKVSSMLVGKNSGKYRRVVDSSALFEALKEKEEDIWLEEVHNFVNKCHEDNRINLLRRIQEEMITIAEKLKEVVNRSELEALEADAEILMKQADLSRYKAQ